MSNYERKTLIKMSSNLFYDILNSSSLTKEDAIRLSTTDLGYIGTDNMTLQQLRSYNRQLLSNYLSIDSGEEHHE